MLEFKTVTLLGANGTMGANSAWILRAYSVWRASWILLATGLSWPKH